MRLRVYQPQSVSQEYFGTRFDTNPRRQPRASLHGCMQRRQPTDAKCRGASLEFTLVLPSLTLKQAPPTLCLTFAYRQCHSIHTKLTTSPPDIGSDHATLCALCCQKGHPLRHPVDGPHLANESPSPISTAFYWAASNPRSGVLDVSS